jgi:hypothetical protein
MTRATRLALAATFGRFPHGPVYVVDMGSWRHYVCRMCEVGAVTGRYRRGQVKAFLGVHAVQPDPAWLERVEAAQKAVAAHA